MLLHIIRWYLESFSPREVFDQRYRGRRLLEAVNGFCELDLAYSFVFVDGLIIRLDVIVIPSLHDVLLTLEEAFAVIFKDLRFLNQWERLGQDLTLHFLGFVFPGTPCMPYFQLIS